MKERCKLYIREWEGTVWRFKVIPLLSGCKYDVDDID
jgi:hypothetical protein